MISFTSPPVQNAVPVPVRIATLTAGRSRSARKASISSPYTSKVSAFKAAGRSRRRVAIAPFSS